VAPLAALQKHPTKNALSMDTKADFHKTIFNHLHGLANGKISDALLEELTERINKYYYEQYSRFAKQYPKSVLRYSTFQIVDLEHPTTYEMIIAFFKGKLGENYAQASEVILKMSSSELKEFEKSRIDFQNMF